MRRTGRSLDSDPCKLIYLSAWRHPLDELARREARILVALLRAEQQRLSGTSNLVGPQQLCARSI